MKRTLHDDVCSWSDIKAQLDPAWDYAVIEATAVSSGIDVFNSVKTLLSEHADGIRKQTICCEPISGKLLMLVQIVPEKTVNVRRTLFGPSMPTGVTVYLYNHPLGAATRNKGFQREP